MSPVTGTLQTGLYTIENVQNRLNVVLQDGSAKNRPLVARPDPASNSAKWNITVQPNGSYHIKSFAAPLHAATVPHGAEAGAQVKTLDTRAQAWTIRETSTSGNYIISVQGGEYFWGLPDDEEESFVQLASVPNHKINQWHFTPTRG